MDTKIDVRPVELLITTGNEFRDYVKNLDAINVLREKNGLGTLFTAAKETRHDLRTGKKYSILSVYKIGLDKKNPAKPVKFQEVIPVNAEGEIMQEVDQKVKLASVVANSERIEHWQAMRGLKLQAAVMNAHAGDFDFGVTEAINEDA